MTEDTGLFRVDLAYRECDTDRVSDRQQRKRLLQGLQRVGLRELVGSDPGAAQSGEVAPDAQRGAEVPSQSAHIGAG